MALLFFLLIVGLLLSPLLGADSRDGHDWTPHYFWPYPGTNGDCGDYWSEKIHRRFSRAQTNGIQTSGTHKVA